MARTPRSTTELALKRTELANDRTLLAFIRTALALGGIAIAVVKLFAGTGVYVVAALSGLLAVLVFVLGFYQWRQSKHFMKGEKDLN